MRKTYVVLFCMIAFLAAGCSKQSGGLGQFVGKWAATYALSDSTGVRVSSGTLAVKQPAADTVSFEESTSHVTGVGQFGVPITSSNSFNVTLKETSPTTYLLSLKVNGNHIVSALPMMFSESEGFKGQGSNTTDGKSQTVLASIKKEGDGHIWKISSDAGSPSKFNYEFNFKEKS